MVKKILFLIYKYQIYILLTLCISSTLYLIFFLPTTNLSISHTHMLDLGKSFLSGKLNLAKPLDPSVAIGDIAYFKNNYYVYFGPFPAILLMPLILLFNIKSQWILLPPLMIVTFYCLLKICKSIGLTSERSLWLTIAFFFGTVYLFLFLTNITAYYIQIVGTSLLIISIYFFISKKNYLFSAIMLSFAGMTRQILYLGIFFFLIEFFIERCNKNFKIKNLIIFLIPISLSVILLCIYNYLRFGSIIQDGYVLNITTQNYLYFRAAQDKGFFSLAHIPGNLYLFLFKWLEPIRYNSINYELKFPYFKADPWGTGIFFTSPFLLYIFFARIKDRFVLSSIITSLIFCIFILSYFNSGFWQYGYRYALDFYPFLFLILISSFKKRFSISNKILILWSILFNNFFMFSVWNIYPFLTKNLWP